MSEQKNESKRRRLFEVTITTNDGASVAHKNASVVDPRTTGPFVAVSLFDDDGNPIEERWMRADDVKGIVAKAVK